ncbi:hypothetical protein EJB05_31852, partial [Eragrostis curvula]
MTGERQATRIRSLYLKSILKQDIAFFDIEMTTGQVVSRMSGDTILIHDAVGEKVGKFLQLMANFIGGFIIAFVKGSLLSLAILSCIPPVVIAGGVVSKIVYKLSSKGQASYNDAGNVVEETLGAIKTVVSFNGEKQAVKSYNKFIHKAYKASVDEGIANGFGLGSIFFILFSSYGLAIWYGGKLILSRGYTGGDIISILFAIMMGALSLGPHDELVMNPYGAYSQLIQLQESPYAEEQKLDRNISDLRSQSRSLSPMQSIGRSSAGNSSRHSRILPFDFSGSLEMLEGDNTNENRHQDESGDGEVSGKAIIRRLIHLNNPEQPILLLGSIAAGVHGALYPLTGVIVTNAIKTFYEPADKIRNDSKYWSSMCVILGIISIISIPVEYFLFGVAGGKLIKRIRYLSFQTIVHQEVSWFDHPKNSSGALGARLLVDALNVRRLVGDNLALLVQVTSSLVTGFLIAMIADWKLCLIILSVIPLAGLQGYAEMMFLKGFNEDAKLLYEDANQVATDAISGIRTVASFCAEKRVMTTYNKKCEASKNQGVRIGIVGGLGFGFSFLVLNLTYGLCFYVGAQFIRHEKSTFGDVFKVFFALMLATIGISQTSAMASDSTKAKESAMSIFGLLDRKSEIDSSSDEGLTLDEVEGNIEFQHVSFKYPSRPDVQIFSDFTLHIPSGKFGCAMNSLGSRAVERNFVFCMWRSSSSLAAMRGRARRVRHLQLASATPRCAPRRRLNHLPRGGHLRVRRQAAVPLLRVMLQARAASSTTRRAADYERACQAYNSPPRLVEVGYAKPCQLALSQSLHALVCKEYQSFFLVASSVAVSLLSARERLRCARRAAVIKGHALSGVVAQKWGGGKSHAFAVASKNMSGRFMAAEHGKLLPETALTMPFMIICMYK